MSPVPAFHLTLVTQASSIVVWEKALQGTSGALSSRPLSILSGWVAWATLSEYQLCTFLTTSLGSDKMSLERETQKFPNDPKLAWIN